MLPSKIQWKLCVCVCVFFVILNRNQAINVTMLVVLVTTFLCCFSNCWIAACFCFLFLAFLHWRRGIIQQIAFLRVRVVFKTLWECYFSLKRWLFCLYLFVYLSFPKFLNYLIKTGTICWIIWFKELGWKYSRLAFRILK